MESPLAAKRPRAIAFLATPFGFTSITYSSTFSTSLIPLHRRPLLSSQRRRTRYSAMPRPTTCTKNGYEDDEDLEISPDEDSEMTVYRNNGARRKYNGDALPFDVSVISPPPEYLGRFQLDPRTHNGDIVEHDGRQFVVKCVRMRYKYSQGKYQMIGKVIEVKSLARKSIESFLERALGES